MSEFKFLCPACGQKILANTGYSGIEIACPACQKTITIPVAVLAPVLNPALAGVAMGSPPPPPVPVSQTAARSVPPSPAAAGQPSKTPDRFSGLAAASLICSVLVPFGSIPGIVCGHLAKARLRRNILLSGEKMANAGLLISYCVLLATVALAGIFLLQHLRYKPVMVMRESPEAIAALQPRTVDEVIINENEDDHDMIGQMYSSTTTKGKTYRSATRGGSFGYTMKVLPHEAMTLNCRYSGGEKKDHVFDIAVDDQIIATQDLNAVAPGHFVDMEYKIPKSLTAGKDEVKVEFQARPRMTAGGLYGCQMLRP